MNAREALQAVVDVWNGEGKEPVEHRRRQARVQVEWLELAQAVEQAARVAAERAPDEDEVEALAWIIERAWGNPYWDGKTLRPLDRTIARAILAAGFHRNPAPVTDEQADGWVVAPDGEQFRPGECQGHAECPAEEHIEGCFATVREAGR